MRINNYLFLRGEYDKNNEKSLEDDSDMWLQLFASICDRGTVWFKSNVEIKNIDYRTNLNIEISSYPSNLENYTHVFARGAFSYYTPILKACNNAYKIRYSAGSKRVMPSEDIKYDLILVDTKSQKNAILKRHHASKVEILIKPAAECFRPLDVIKEYDVCFIANSAQKAFKGIDWVYETAPKNLKILHLGYHDSLNPPINITCKRVDRIDMPKWINKCRVGIVPYDNIDSCPRVIPEMTACGLPLIIMDTVNFPESQYRTCLIRPKEKFWDSVKGTMKCNAHNIDKCYEKELSLPIAAQYIKDLIHESDKKIHSKS